MTRSSDVIVIGAGAAGLAAAGDLSGRDARVEVIEARDRIGGRMHTLTRAGVPPIELGAEFIDVPGTAWDSLRAAGGLAVRSAGGMWEITGGRAQPLDMEGLAERVFRRLRRLPERDVPFDEWLARLRSIDRRTRTWIRRYVEGFHAAELGKVGIHWLAKTAEESSGGGGAVRFHALDGFGRVAEHLCAGLGPEVRLHLNVVARKIRWSRRGVDVECETSSGGLAPTLRARHVIVTLPLGVLQAFESSSDGGLFDPPIPEKRDAVNALAMGSVLKIVFRFREPFWDDVLTFPRGASPSTEHKFFFTGDPFPTWWTASPLVAPTLTAWAGGGAAMRARAIGRPVDVALDALADMLGVRRSRVRRLLEEWHFHDWDRDPYSRGAYSYVPPGALGARRALARPVDGTVFFAGEATASNGHNGTVDGAIESGRRAVREIDRGGRRSRA